MSNPIQGNEKFTKVSNTVLSSVAFEDSLNNAGVLVERVAKGFVPLTKTSGGFLNVFAKEGETLVLPERAIVTQVFTYFNDDLKFGTNPIVNFLTRDNSPNEAFDNTNVAYFSIILNFFKNPSIMTQNIVLKYDLQGPETGIARSGFGEVMMNLQTLSIFGTELSNLYTARYSYLFNANAANKTAYENAISAYNTAVATAVANGSLVNTAGTLQVKIHYVTPEFSN